MDPDFGKRALDRRPEARVRDPVIASPSRSSEEAARWRRGPSS
ncbi:Hypothetical protein A7982_08027 [Minicystis rosea]|nr:Hypothetical protein A7982_08027 [Minicystis rosea]